MAWETCLVWHVGAVGCILLDVTNVSWKKVIRKSCGKFAAISFLSISLAIGWVADAFASEQTRTYAKGDSRVPENTLVLKNVPYVTEGHEMQKLDLMVPPSQEKLPLLVWVHGGAWEAGDKEEQPFYRFLKQGYAVASINYRLSQVAVYPAQIEDCKSAIRWLRAHAQEFGYRPDRIGVGGGSAGGHLVALLGATGHTRMFDVGEYLNESSRVQVVCDFFGPTDFGNYDYASTIFKAPQDSPFSRLLGCNPMKNMSSVYRSSPRYFVTSTHAPIIIFHGNKDDLVPLYQSQLYLETLAQVGVESSLFIIEGGGHGFSGERIWSEIDHMFAKHLKPEKKVGYSELVVLP